MRRYVHMYTSVAVIYISIKLLSSMLGLRIPAPADPISCPCASNVASLMPRLYLGDGSIQNDDGGGDENMSTVNGTLAACRL